MKKNIKAIIMCGVLLVLFPFVALSEFWEYLYVTIPAVVLTYNALVLGKKAKLFSENDNADSLQGYIKKIQDKFQDSPDDEELEQMEVVTKSFDGIKNVDH